MKKILIVANDSGGSNFIASYFYFKNYEFDTILTGPAKKIFLSYKLKFKNYSKSKLKHIIKNYDLIITGTSNKSNLERKEFICDHLIRMNPKSYGFYRLNMKEESDNLRESASIYLLKKIIEQKRKVYVYEPLISKNTYYGAEVIIDLDEFKEKSGLIIANRTSADIYDCQDRLFSRDLNF